LNRRNITDGQRTYLIGKRYKGEKKAIGENQYTEDNSIKRVGNNCPAMPTANKIAEQTNVAPRTVKNAEKFADAVDKVSEKKDGFLRSVWLSFLNMSGVFVFLCFEWL
jgi:hypothetical protein